MRKKRFMLVVVAAAVTFGCSKQSGTTAIKGDSSPVSAGITAYSSELKPFVETVANLPKSEGVAQARHDAKEHEKISVSGRVKDFVDGKAMFTMVDSAIPSCLETMPGEPTPWDYCCQPKDELIRNMATVRIEKKETGEAMDGVIQGINGLDHLTTVVVEGEAEKDKAGNLVIAASKIYLKQKS